MDSDNSFEELVEKEMGEHPQLSQEGAELIVRQHLARGERNPEGGDEELQDMISRLKEDMEEGLEPEPIPESPKPYKDSFELNKEAIDKMSIEQLVQILKAGAPSGSSGVIRKASSKVRGQPTMLTPLRKSPLRKDGIHSRVIEESPKIPKSRWTVAFVTSQQRIAAEIVALLKTIDVQWITKNGLKKLKMPARIVKEGDKFKVITPLMFHSRAFAVASNYIGVKQRKAREKLEQFSNTLSSEQREFSDALFLAKIKGGDINDDDYPAVSSGDKKNIRDIVNVILAERKTNPSMRTRARLNPQSAKTIQDYVLFHLLAATMESQSGDMVQARIAFMVSDILYRFALNSVDRLEIEQLVPGFKRQYNATYRVCKSQRGGPAETHEDFLQYGFAKLKNQPDLMNQYEPLDPDQPFIGEVEDNPATPQQASLITNTAEAITRQSFIFEQIAGEFKFEMFNPLDNDAMFGTVALKRDIKHDSRIGDAYRLVFTRPNGAPAYQKLLNSRVTRVEFADYCRAGLTLLLQIWD